MDRGGAAYYESSFLLHSGSKGGEMEAFTQRTLDLPLSRLIERSCSAKHSQLVFYFSSLSEITMRKWKSTCGLTLHLTRGCLAKMFVSFSSLPREKWQ